MKVWYRFILLNGSLGKNVWEKKIQIYCENWKERKMYSRFKNVYSFQRNGVSNLLSAYNSPAKVSKILPQAST